MVDNSSALRYDDDVPLVVPEVNGQLCEGNKVIANPNCTTAIALMALFPLFLAFGLKKVIVSTYQAASGAGAASSFLRSTDMTGGALGGACLVPCALRVGCYGAAFLSSCSECWPAGAFVLGPRGLGGSRGRLLGAWGRGAG